MDRKRYIGSSDAADIMAMNYHRLYRLKMGFDQPEDLSANWKVQLGVITEQFHLDWTIAALNRERVSDWQWSKRTKDGVQHFASFLPEGMTWELGSTPDALLKSGSTHLPVEVKHTGRFHTVEEAADFYMPQLQHHMLVWNAPNILFSVIIGTEEPERRWIGFSQDYADIYLARCAQFMEFVETETPPPPALFGDTTKIILPSAVTDGIPFDGMTRRDLSTSNRAMELVPKFIAGKAAADAFDAVKKELKSMMADDERELYCKDLVIKRNRAGAIGFTILADKPTKTA